MFMFVQLKPYKSYCDFTGFAVYEYNICLPWSTHKLDFQEFSIDTHDISATSIVRFVKDPVSFGTSTTNDRFVEQTTSTEWVLYADKATRDGVRNEMSFDETRVGA